MRRGSLVQLTLVGLVAAGAAVAVALLFHWLPERSSEQAGRIHFLFWFVTGISIAIFALVAAVIAYSVVKFRARPDDDSDGPPIHGHTGLEIAWTAVPAVLVTAIAIVAAIVLAKNESLAKNHMTVDVTAQQFAWSFKYPGFKNVTSGFLRLPVGESVELNLTSLDVIHSFWVPEFSQKQDALPGSTTHLVITPDRLGSYPVICTELCGLGHAVMRTQAIVMERDAFDAWIRKQSGAVATGGTEGGKAVFTANGCASCHTLKAAGAKGTVGPDLDKLPAEAQRAGKPLEAFVRESIVNPDAYVEKGYPPNVMPKTFAQLPKSQLDALVQYLISSSKKGS